MEKTSDRDELFSLKSSANDVAFENTRISIDPPAVQLKADDKLEPESEDKAPAETPFQLAAEGSEPPADNGNISNGGNPNQNNTGLPDQLKSGVESLSGYSLDDVKVHYNSDKPAQLQAHAYAQGSDIHLGPGQEKHLPHEAWHVVQQKQGRVQATKQMKAFTINDDAGLEKEADVMGARAMQIKSNAKPSSLKSQRTPSDAFQLKGEFKTLYGQNPELAMSTVRFQNSTYEVSQNEFEKNLGLGLFTNPLALDGANIMLAKIEAAMLAAGFSDDDVLESFAQTRGKAELGGLLKKDVRAAINGTNMREKMGMVYQSRFKICEAIDELLSMAGHGGIALGEEIQSEAMKASIASVTTAGKSPSRAMLARRNSVNMQIRHRGDQNPTTKASDLAADGIDLTDREKRRADEEHMDADHTFIPGKEYYKLPAEKITDETYNLRRTLAGLSGSTDMYFHLAKHLSFTDSELKKLRLAALAQMLTNQDHSYHEIMHVAKTQGGLDDYADTLPLGYTTLAPLDDDGILAVANSADFPGDAEVRNQEGGFGTSSLADKAEITDANRGGAAPRKKGKNYYYKILRNVDAYQDNPTRETLEKIIDLCTKWYNKKKPGRLARRATKLAWGNNSKRKTVEWIKKKAESLKQEQTQNLNLPFVNAIGFIKQRAQDLSQSPLPAPKILHERKRLHDFVRKYRLKLIEDFKLLPPGAGDRAQLDSQLNQLKGLHLYLKSFENNHNNDFFNPDFRASQEDLSMDMSAINIDVNDDSIKRFRASSLRQPDGTWGNITADLEEDLKNYVIENRSLMAKAGKDVTGVPDLQPPAADMLERRKRATEAALPLPGDYTKDQTDFTDNIDTSMIAALQPLTPMGKFLREIEGEVLPQELQAILGYAEEGFYQIMNGVLNKAHDKEYLATVPQNVLSLISLAISGLRKMKPYTGGKVYRGANGIRGRDVDRLTVGRTQAQRQREWNRRFPIGQNQSFNQFVSTSKRSHSSYISKHGKYAAYEINNIKTGIDISAIANTMNEREVLFPPGTNFRITNVEDKFADKAADGTITNAANKHEATANGETGRIKIEMDEV